MTTRTHSKKSTKFITQSPNCNYDPGHTCGTAIIVKYNQVQPEYAKLKWAPSGRVVGKAPTQYQWTASSSTGYHSWWFCEQCHYFNALFEIQEIPI